MKKEKQEFRILAGRPTAISSMIAFMLCIPTQTLGYAERASEPIIAMTLIVLPVLSAALMIVTIIVFGRNHLRLSIIPVCIGVLGFLFKLMIDPHETGLLHHVFAAVLYVLIIVLWALTVFYIIRTKWILTVFFLIPFFKHIFLNDIPVLLGTESPLPFSGWMKEFSMLFFMLALSLCAVSFEKIKQ